MLKIFVRTTTCLAVSAAALIAVTTLDAIAAKPRSPSVPETTEAKPAPKPPAPKPTEPPPKLTVANLAPQPAPKATSPATTSVDADSTLTVPDWKGKRLSVALREARKLGLHAIAFDETGRAVLAHEASGYRVRRMLTKAGTTVEPGGDVEVRVREALDPAMGY